jgi:hypothetical protein
MGHEKMSDAATDNKTTNGTGNGAATKKRRPDIPKAVWEKVMNEFNHRCAICGESRPQVHHIDQNPANNDPANLIPLCPNCHLIDQHNPTDPMDPFKLALFRKYKDPVLLSPQFHPLFKRIQSYEELFASDRGFFDELHSKLVIANVLKFISFLEMGGYYKDAIEAVIRWDFVDSYQTKTITDEFNNSINRRDYLNSAVKLRKATPTFIEDTRYKQTWEMEAEAAELDKKINEIYERLTTSRRSDEAHYRQKAKAMMPRVWELIIEMLRYQKWDLPPRRKPAER